MSFLWDMWDMIGYKGSETKEVVGGLLGNVADTTGNVAGSIWDSMSTVDPEKRARIEANKEALKQRRLQGDEFGNTPNAWLYNSEFSDDPNKFSRFFKNIVPNTASLYTEGSDMLQIPQDVIKPVGELVVGGVLNLSPIGGLLSEDVGVEQREMANQFAIMVKDNFKDWESISNMIANRPLDAMGIMIGAGYGAKRIADLASNPAIKESVRNTLRNMPDPADVMGNAPLVGQFFPNTKIPIISWHGNPYGQKYMQFDFDKIGEGMGVQRQAWGMNISAQEATGVSFAGQVDPALSTIYRHKLDNDYLSPIEREVWGQAELGIRPEVVEKRVIEKFHPPTEFNKNLAIPVATKAEIEKVMMQFEAYHENSMAQVYKLDLHDDKVKLMINELKPMSQQPLNVQKIMKEQKADGWDINSETTGREFYDMLSEYFVEQTGGEGARKMASLYLLENGIPGMQYLDDVTRTDWKVTEGLLAQQGEPKYSYTVFDNSSHTMLTRQGQDIYKDAMIAQHALSEEALLKHLEATGVPMPSIATTKADKPLQGFGEITLVSDPSMITPSGKTKTYPVDMYSGRAPKDDLVYKDLDAVLNSIDPEELRFHANVNPITDPEAMTKYNTKMNKGKLLEGKVRGNLKQLSPGILEKQMKQVQLAIDKGYDPYQYPTYRKAMYEIDELRRKEGLWAMEKYSTTYYPKSGLLGETLRTMTNPKGAYTELGNRRADVPYSAETALKVMRRNKAYQPGSEGYQALNQTIALASTPFKNLDEIKKSRGLLEDKKGYSEGDATELFEADLDAVKEKLNKLGGAPWNREAVNTGYRDDLIDMVLLSGRLTSEDIARLKYTPDEAKEAVKIILSLKEKGKQLHSEQWVKENPEMAELTTTSGQLSTEYFESKPNRIVDIGEFKGAIVPKEIPKYLEKLLKNAGIKKILKYGSEKERIELFKKFPELMFAGMAIPTAGLLATQETEQGKLRGGLLK